jgi:hypothetical protein
VVSYLVDPDIRVVDMLVIYPPKVCPPADIDVVMLLGEEELCIRA